MNKSKSKKTNHIYQLKITLKGTKPPIWRRFLVSSNIKFSELHSIIQEVMGWNDVHLYSFNTGNTNTVSYSIASRRDPFGGLLNDFYADYEAEKIKILDWLTDVKDKITYEYDFGDGWEHEVIVEKILEANEVTEPLPVCIAGKLKCPPEDCGGVWGFKDLQTILLNQRHPEYNNMLEWLGGEVPDWEYFAVEEVNQSLERFRPKSGKKIASPSTT